MNPQSLIFCGNKSKISSPKSKNSINGIHKKMPRMDLIKNRWAPMQTKRQNWGIWRAMQVCIWRSRFNFEFKVFSKYLSWINSAAFISKYLLSAVNPSSAFKQFKDNTITYNIQILSVFFIFMWFYFKLNFFYFIFNFCLFETGFLCVSLAVMELTL